MFDFGLDNEDEDFEKEMLHLRNFINRSRRAHPFKKKLYIQDLLTFFAIKYKIQSWELMRRWEEEFIDDVLEAQEYFEQMEWYEELAYIKDGINYALTQQQKIHENRDTE